MDRVTLDADLRQRLGDLSKVIEVCDEDGRVVSQLVPAPQEYVSIPYSDDEIRRIAANTTQWYTTDQVLAHLRNLGGQ